MTTPVPAEAWRKSTYSSGGNPNCVEVGPGKQTVGVRDTKNRDAGSLAVSHAAWTTFISSVTAR